MRTQLLLLLVLSVGLALSIPVLLGGGDTLSLLAHISTVAIATLLFIVLLVWLFNAARVFLLFRGAGHALGFRKIFTYVLACDFSVKATPAGLGGPITAITVLRENDIYPAKTAAAYALLFTLDIVVIIVLSVMLYLASYQQWNTTDLALHISSISVLSVVVLIVIFKLPLYYRRLLTILGRIMGSFPAGKRLRYPLAKQFVAVKKGVKAFLALPVSTRLQIVGYSVAFWLAQFSILYCCLGFLGESPSWIIVASIQFLAMAAGRLTLLPAGAGGMEATSVGLLSFWVDPGIAASAVLLWRSVTLFPALIAGVLAMLTLGIRLETDKNAVPTKST